MRTYWASNELSFEEVAQLFENIGPDVAYSYGSFAEAFLLHVLDQGLAVRLPRVWVFGGDGVSAEGRRRIEEDLACVLYSTYQAVEVGRFGFECEMLSGYHMNTDFCHVRLVNEEGETAEAGEIGEVVVSNLSSTGSILLNYRLGDYAAWSTEPCTCGRTLPLLRLAGTRIGICLRLRDGSELHEYTLEQVCDESLQDILQFRIIETAPESIVWEVVLSKRAKQKEVVSGLVKQSRSLMSPTADVRVRVVDRIILPPGSILTRIIRSSADDVEIV